MVTDFHGKFNQFCFETAEMLSSLRKANSDLGFAHLNFQELRIISDSLHQT